MGPSPKPNRSPSPGSSAARASRTAIHRAVERYYTAKIALHGPTAAGVDWSCEATQELRFLQLLRLCEFGPPFSLNDLGCGYGALFGCIGRNWPAQAVDYLGVDLSKAMVAQARRLWRGARAARFRVGHGSPRTADYSVASGVFNVMLDAQRDAWEDFIRSTLTRLRDTSARGFAVNFLAPLPPHLPQPRELYRCAPSVWQDFCARHLSVQARLLAGYGLNEYTLIVRNR